MDDDPAGPDEPTVWRVEVPPGDAEVAADHLWQSGAGAVVVEDRDRRVVLTSDAAPAGPLPVSWRVEAAPTSAVISRRWLDGRGPVTVGPWTVHHPDVAVSGPGAVAIDPGDTFGSGHHPTTRLALTELAGRVAAGCRLLDVGCGSGVLAVAAAVAGARCVAVDVDPDAVAVARANVERNGVADRVDVGTGSVPVADGVFDVVVANLLLSDLVDVAEGIRRGLAGDGALVVSGLLFDQVPRATAALALTEVKRSGIGDWVGLVYRREP